MDPMTMYLIGQGLGMGTSFLQGRDQKRLAAKQERAAAMQKLMEALGSRTGSQSPAAGGQSTATSVASGLNDPMTQQLLGMLFKKAIPGVRWGGPGSTNPYGINPYQ